MLDLRTRGGSSAGLRSEEEKRPGVAARPPRAAVRPHGALSSAPAARVGRSEALWVAPAARVWASHPPGFLYEDLFRLIIIMFVQTKHNDATCCVMSVTDVCNYVRYNNISDSTNQLVQGCNRTSWWTSQTPYSCSEGTASDECA